LTVVAPWLPDWLPPPPIELGGALVEPAPVELGVLPSPVGRAVVGELAAGVLLVVGSAALPAAGVVEGWWAGAGFGVLTLWRSAVAADGGAWRAVT
jgi:uncharacterized membrane protein YphA (DoxX/SURF4 family)